MQVGIIGGHGTEYGLRFRPCVSERREASGALKCTYLTVKGGRHVALITTFTALRGMSCIVHSITLGSPLWRHRSQPTIHPNIPSGVPRGIEPWALMWEARVKTTSPAGLFKLVSLPTTQYLYQFCKETVRTLDLRLPTPQSPVAF